MTDIPWGERPTSEYVWIEDLDELKKEGFTGWAIRNDKGGFDMYSDDTCAWSAGLEGHTYKVHHKPEPKAFEPVAGMKCEIAASTEYRHIRYKEGMKVKIYTSFYSDNGIELFAFISLNNQDGGVAVAESFRPIKSDKEVFIEKAFGTKSLDVTDIIENSIKGDSLTRLLASMYDAGFKAPERKS